MDERQAFEAAHRTAYPHASLRTNGEQRRNTVELARNRFNLPYEFVPQDNDGDYHYPDVQRRWEGWRMARAAQPTPETLGALA